MRQRICQAVSLVLLSVVANGSCHAEKQTALFPGYSDAATAALWLFDEPLDPPASPPPAVTPWYYTQTLTDASRNYYDLHRLHGGAIEAGRFGRALRIRGTAIGPGMQLAANFASEPRVYGVFLPADHEFVPSSPKEQDSIANFFWYTVQPDRVVESLSGDQWTIELWLRLSKRPSDAVCLIDAGQGAQTALRVELIDSGAACRLTVPAAKGAVVCDVAQAKLGDGQWHHLALLKPTGRSEMEAFVDGRRVSTTEFEQASPESIGTTKPDLVARTFGELDFDRPQSVFTAAGAGPSLASMGANAKSIRLRGWVKAPASGEVRFETDATSGLHVDVNHRPLTYGWFGRAAIYRRSPRWGTVRMKEGELYPVFIEMQHGEADLPFSEQRLYWSWQGSSKHPIPDTAWVHTDQDVRNADDDEGGGFTPAALMKTRFNLALGSNRSGADALDGWLDELRISSIARYASDFTPTTHSLNYGPDPPPATQPTGPPLLFSGKDGANSLPLGSRKHVFIDDALIDQSAGIQFVVNRPQDPQSLEPELPHGDHSFFDLDGNVALFAPAGYEGKDDFAYLWVAKDGLHFRLHDALAPEGGSKVPRPIMTDVPAWGRMAIDENPDTPKWARFKYTAGVPHRGIYLLVSPDAIHWRRNETIMLQVGTGGESHWYWDDQTGEYRYLLKWDHGPGGRQSVEASTRKCFEPWPLAADGDALKDLATPLGYMPSRFAPDKELGEVYRSRGIKYPWAPDVYLAFLWRFDTKTKARQVELAVSRDGKRWKHFGDNWYMPAEFAYQDQQIHEVTSVDGMVRRGDQIWQYADYSTGRHDSSKPGWRVRLTQRLDGFVSLDAGVKGGQFITKPFTFAGDTLTLNVAVEDAGALQVAILDGNGTSLPGFSPDDCETIHADSTGYQVTWKSHGDLSELAGKPVRLLFRMQRAKLYALQFE
ncbi:MAG: LamG-like jellyroll fold domain-containing protein [Pirellulales bacterium]